MGDDADRIAGVWNATGVARAWAASVHRAAARSEHRKALEANAMVEAAMLRAADANKSAVGARNRVDAAAIGRAADEHGKASDALVQAAVAFIKMSRQIRMEADEHVRAAEAYERAGIVVSERAALRTAVASLELALTMSGRSTSMVSDAYKYRQLADRWAANAAKWKRGCYDWGGHHDEWVAEWTRVFAEVEANRAKSAWMVETAAAEEREAAHESKRAAAAAERAGAAAAAAAAAAAEGGHRGQDMQEAVTAWKAAMAAASRAEEYGEAGRTG